ncbi:tetratricopeptide repeat protein [candidate division WOR-3 bacterium]|nr:tetratricopeptide repeat protein [candidate division WOR-3 bacterium]
MRDLIPQFIAANYSNGVKCGKFDGAVIFADISGFTEMTKTLMEKGTEGIEVLTLTINDVFTPALSIVSSSGGFVTVFGGDAFYAVFDSSSDDFTSRALFCAQEITKLFEESGIKKTSSGVFTLSVKTGLSLGEINWGIIENPFQNSYYFKGPPIDSAAKIQSFCKKNSVAADGFFAASFKDRRMFHQTENGVFSTLCKVSPTKNRLHQKKTAFSVAKSFFPAGILETTVKGEFREVVSVFFSFKDTPFTSDNISKTISLVAKTGGYFNRVSYGDKGGFVLAFFGAPSGKELLCERASKMALSVSKIPDFMICAGISFGMCFAGFTGSEERAEYTCQGEKVNLAARLMSLKDENLPREPRILIDKEVFGKIKDGFSAEFLKNATLKGFEEPVPVYLLSDDREERSRVRKGGKIVGRQKQLRAASDLLTKAKEGAGGVLMLKGDAGTGKSFFIEELASLHPSFTWIFMPCDQIFRSSLNPASHFIKDFFSISKNANSENTLESIREKTKKIMMSGEIRDKREHDIIVYYFATLAGLNPKDSFLDSLNPKNKKDETVYYVKSLIKSMSQNNPTAVFIDDLHWIDEDSKVLLKDICSNTLNLPLVVITAQRPIDEIVERSFMQDLPGRVTQIMLEPFSRSDSYELVRELLGSDEVPLSTLDRIHDKSEGNPFFIQQTVSFLTENKILSDDFRFSEGTDFIPSDVRTIIVSRVDRFEKFLKNAVLKASVLGREFSSDILASMDLERPLENVIADGLRTNVWRNIGGRKFEFTHALIRDSVYDMQLKSDLRAHHARAARIYENLPGDRRESDPGIIAHHYDMAMDSEKAPFFLKKAIEKAENNFATSDALRFCDALDKYLPPGKEKISNSIEKTKLMLLDGNLNEAEIFGEKILSEITKSRENDFLPKCLLRLIEITQRLFKLDKNMSYIKQAKKYLATFKDEDFEMDILKATAFYWHSKENIKKAFEYFEKALDLSRRLKDKKSESHLLSDIAIFCGNELGFDKVLDYLFEGLKIAEEIGDIKNEEIIYSNIALSYQELFLDVEKSFEYYQKAMSLSQKFGDKPALMNELNNIAIIYQLKGDDESALDCFNRSLDMAVEKGHKMASVNALGNLSAYFRFSGNFTKSLGYIERAERMVENTPMEELLLRILMDKFETILGLKDFEAAEKLLERINLIHRKLHSCDWEKYAFGKLRIFYLTTGEKHAIISMENEAEKIKEKSVKASFYLKIWEITGSSKYAELSREFFTRIIEEPPENYKDFYWILQRRKLEKFLEKNSTADGKPESENTSGTSFG